MKQISNNNLRFVGVISSFRDFQIAGTTTGCCDLVEVRLDYFSKQDFPKIEGVLKELSLPTIITVRDESEGGRSKYDSQKERAEIYERFIPHATMIDIETLKLHTMKYVLRKARDAGVVTIGSHHQFTVFDKVMAESQKQVAVRNNVDIFKFASVASVTDMIEMSSLFEGEIPCSIMCMGEFGKISRLLFSRLGSVLNYGSLGEAIVAGQWPIGELKNIAKKL